MRKNLLLLCTLLGLSTFIACGNTTNTNSTDTNSVDSTTESTPNEDNETVEIPATREQFKIFTYEFKNEKKERTDSLSLNDIIGMLDCYESEPPEKEIIPIENLVTLQDIIPASPEDGPSKTNYEFYYLADSSEEHKFVTCCFEVYNDTEQEITTQDAFSQGKWFLDLHTDHEAVNTLFSLPVDTFNNEHFRNYSNDSDYLGLIDEHFGKPDKVMSGWIDLENGSIDYDLCYEFENYALIIDCSEQYIYDDLHACIECMYITSHEGYEFQLQNGGTPPTRRTSNEPMAEETTNNGLDLITIAFN